MLHLHGLEHHEHVAGRHLLADTTSTRTTLPGNGSEQRTDRGLVLEHRETVDDMQRGRAERAVDVDGVADPLDRSTDDARRRISKSTEISARVEDADVTIDSVHAHSNLRH